MKEKIKKIGGLVIGGLLIGSLGYAVGNACVEPQVSIKTVEKVINATPEQLSKAFREGMDSVEPIVEYVDKIEVKPDESFNQKIYPYMYDMNGDLRDIIDDLDDDEADKLVDRIDDVIVAKELAKNEVKAELFDELDGEEYT